VDRDKIMVLGGGPNRIGQGIEFDYCCVHASLALRDYRVCCTIGVDGDPGGLNRNIRDFTGFTNANHKADVPENTLNSPLFRLPR
ncbi:hypothetical protein FK513_28790, partial [Klebsiella pneumoniae]|nr:hypothetical protein [Klebsiella pneumoniae]